MHVAIIALAVMWRVPALKLQQAALARAPDHASTTALLDELGKQCQHIDPQHSSLQSSVSSAIGIPVDHDLAAGKIDRLHILAADELQQAIDFAGGKIEIVSSQVSTQGKHAHLICRLHLQT